MLASTARLPALPPGTTETDQPCPCDENRRNSSTSQDCCAKAVTPQGYANSIQSDVAMRVQRCPGFEAALDAPGLG